MSASIRDYGCLLCFVCLFYVGSEDSNSVCQGCSASILPADASPQLAGYTHKKDFSKSTYQAFTENIPCLSTQKKETAVSEDTGT